MAQKLELKDLACYLPYGIMCQYEGIINGKELAAEQKQFATDGHPFDFAAKPKKGLKIAPIKEIRLYKNYWKAYIGNYPRHAKSFVNGIGFKPLVIPLSQLTKEEWVEVFKAGCAEFNDKFSVDIDNENWVTLDLCYDISTFDFRWKEFKISHHMPPFNQLAAFQKLYSLHADLDDLIGKKIGLNKLDFK